MTKGVVEEAAVSTLTSHEAFGAAGANEQTILLAVRGKGHAEIGTLRDSTNKRDVSIRYVLVRRQEHLCCDYLVA
jgi:hypothetical protein